MCGGNWMWNGGWGWGGWLMMTLGMIMFFALVIGAVVAAARYFGSAPHDPQNAPPQSTPSLLLAERFARGEIDADEYQRRMVLLREHSGTGR